MITRSTEFCSLAEVPETTMMGLLVQLVPVVAPGLAAVPEPTTWTHFATRDERAGLGDGEIVQTYKASLSQHIRLTKTISQRFVDSKFGPIQMGDRISYQATGQGESLHFELYINTDGHNTVYFMVSAKPAELETLLGLFGQTFTLQV
jgi:hypothetical protein